MPYFPPSSVVGNATGGSVGVVQLAGDLGGSATAPTVEGVDGTGVPANPSIGGVLSATSATTGAWSSAVNVGAWVFDVRAYGAVGNGKVVLDGAMSSSSNTTTLNCNASSPFVLADVGKEITVKGANTAGVTSLVGTIATYVSASQVTLSVACAVTVSGATVMWATDDTAAIQSAINAAVAYAQGHAGHATVNIPPPPGAFYGIAGALVTGTPTFGNSQLTLPVCSATAAAVTLVIESGGDGSSTRYFGQTVPATSGATLLSMATPYSTFSAQNSAVTGNGNPALIGGPTGKNGYGNGSTFSNMTLIMHGITLMTTHSTSGFTYSGANFWGISKVVLRDCSWGTAGTFAGSDYGSLSGFGTGISVGVLLPGNSNNAHTVVTNCTCNGGYTYAVFATEHAVLSACCLLYCWSLLCLVGVYGDGGSGTGAVHAVSVDQLTLEGCINHVDMIGVGSGGVGPALHGTLDCESTQQWTDSTSGTSLAAARGSVHVYGSGLTNVTLVKPSSIEIVNDTVASGPVATPTYSLNTPQVNAFWRWATVYVAPGTGTNITAIQLSALRGGSSAPAMTSIEAQSVGSLPLQSFRVAPGQWWAIDASTGTEPTLQWVLD